MKVLGFAIAILALVVPTGASAATWSATQTSSPSTDITYSVSTSRLTCMDNSSPYTACPSLPFSPGEIVTISGGKNNGFSGTVNTVVNTTPGRQVYMTFTSNVGYVNGLETNGVTVTLTSSAPPPVEGCTDPDANNYDPDAEEDDGSCTYDPDPIPGCTDSDANNYDPDATEDDGSCTYGGGGPGPGPDVPETGESVGWGPDPIQLMAGVAGGVAATGVAVWPLLALVGVGLAFIFAGDVVTFIRKSVNNQPGGLGYDPSRGSGRSRKNRALTDDDEGGNPKVYRF